MDLDGEHFENQLCPGCPGPLRLNLESEFQSLRLDARQAAKGQPDRIDLGESGFGRVESEKTLLDCIENIEV